MNRITNFVLMLAVVTALSTLNVVFAQAPMVCPTVPAGYQVVCYPIAPIAPATNPNCCSSGTTAPTGGCCTSYESVSKTLDDADKIRDKMDGYRKEASAWWQDPLVIIGMLVLITILLTTYVVKQKYTETLSVKSFPSVTVTAGSPAMFPAAPTTPWNCPGGHANPAGATFCYACGVRHP